MLEVSAVQARPLEGEDLLGQLRAQVAQVVQAHPHTGLVVLPELHATGEAAGGTREQLTAVAQPLDGPFSRACARIAQHHGCHLLAGSMVESTADGRLYNTAQLFSREGRRIAVYRKIFPWRPSEPFDPGEEFVVATVDGLRLGLSICYDAWFPEHARQLAWMGADAIVNVVRTTTSDREQEVVLARAAAIANQVYVVSVNAAGPAGAGRSLVVDPQGRVLQTTAAAEELVLGEVLDEHDVQRTRARGTAALNRMWEQFRPGDPPIQLPAYDGRISPSTWSPDQRRCPPTT